mmetsp:Transcript_4899/g.13945  ORF Transcript_4899/g.13945 Transcript_4899/m.13945 type:complete len:98 (-) Transcript_4899:1329-1622(-)
MGVPNSLSPASPNPGMHIPSSFSLSSTVPTLTTMSGWVLISFARPDLEAITDKTYIFGTPHFIVHCGCDQVVNNDQRRDASELHWTPKKCERKQSAK